MNTPNTPNPIRWSSLALMLGSFLFLVNKLDEMSRLFLGRWMSDVISGRNALPILIGQVAFIIGYAGFWQQYAPRSNRISKIALRLLCGGGIAVALSHIGFISALGTIVPPAIRPYTENLFFVLVIGLLLMVIGLIWFGVLALQRQVALRWRWLPLATGLMGFTGFFLFSGEEISAVFLFFRTLSALGLLGLGLLMWWEKPAIESRAVEQRQIETA